MKLSNKHLLLIFGALLIIVFGVRFINTKKAKGNLKSSFFEVDSAEIVRFNIKPLSENKPAFSLIKENQEWFVEGVDQKRFAVSQQAIDYALVEFLKLKPSRLASESQESWTTYEVDTAGTILEIVTKDKSHQIIMGKMAFQNDNMVNTYVRLPDENEVYASECYLERAFKIPIDRWRKKEVYLTPSGFWQQIIIQQEGRTTELIMKEGNWLNNGIPLADSLKDQLISTLNTFNNLPFGNESTTGQTDIQIQIMEEGHAITILKIFNQGNKALLSSSSNFGNYFHIDSANYANLNYAIKLIGMPANSLILKE